jgi:hypothetical protein
MEMQQMLERLLAGQARIEERMDADRKANQELLARIKEDRRANQEFLARMDAYHEKRMAILDAHQKRMIACLGETDANTEKINPGMMQSVEEHQEVPIEDVAVMPVKGLKKRRRVGKSTAGRCGEPKKLNRGNCGSRKKLAAACRKVSRRARMAWQKRKLFRESETRGYCESRKGVTVADRRTSHHATVWRKRILTRNIQIQESRKSSKDFAVNGMRKGPGCKNGIRRRGVKVLPHMRKERKTTNGIKGWSAGQRSHLESGGTPSKYRYKIFGGKMAKQVVGNSRRLRKEMGLVER